jgi:acylphosphatase
VEILASGPPEQLAELRAQLERGPRFASVREVREEEAAPDERFARDFVITHDD